MVKARKVHRFLPRRGFVHRDEPAMQSMVRWQSAVGQAVALMKAGSPFCRFQDQFGGQNGYRRSRFATAFRLTVVADAAAVFCLNR